MDDRDSQADRVRFAEWTVHGLLEGQEHVVTPEVLVPVLAEFFKDQNDDPEERS